MDGVTKLSKLNFDSREDRQAESVRKMLLAMVTDIRVIIVKLADRLHNMRTLGVAAARAPGAHRPGNASISTRPSRTGSAWARSAASWRTWHSSYLEPDACGGADPRDRIEAPGERRVPRSRSSSTVEQKLAREGIPARVDGRVKRAYSVYQKLKRQKITLDQVYDLLAVRIITDSVKNCYAALGVIHNEWHPIPGPHQRLHRHSAAEPVPVAAYLGDRTRRAGIRSADPNGGDAPDRGRRHRGALEI